MQVTFSPKANDDLEFWLKTDHKISSKIFKLIEAIKEQPFNGIGKPEPLKHQLTGYWSRRINKEHRLVYRVSNTEIFILLARGHLLVSYHQPLLHHTNCLFQLMDSTYKMMSIIKN